MPRIGSSWRVVWLLLCTLCCGHSPIALSPSCARSSIRARQMGNYIDVFGYCNLRCPSCPVGNWSDDPAVFHHGLMTEELLGEILDKARRECKIKSVGLFNWTEPLLHPTIHDMISVVRSRGLKCGISSNLNILRRPDLFDEGRTRTGFVYRYGVHAGRVCSWSQGRRHREGQGRSAPPCRGEARGRRDHRHGAVFPQIHRRQLRRGPDEGVRGNRLAIGS